MTAIVAQRPSRAAAPLARGTTWILAGQLVFVACGYLLHAVLSRSLLPAEFGTYGVILGLLGWTEAALQNGVPWAIRRFIAQDPGALRTIVRSGLVWQMALAALLLVTSWLLAPWFSARVNDPSMTRWLQLALLDIIGMALFMYYRGVLNGMRDFGAQGSVTAAYAAIKLLCSAALVWLGLGVSGALMGNIVGAVGGWLIAWWLVRPKVRAAKDPADDSAQSMARYPGRSILSFALPTIGFTLAGNFVLNIGLVAVKALVADGPLVGYFVAANYLGSAPNLLLVAFSMSLFPLVSGSIAAQDVSLTRAYLRSAIRYMALCLFPGIAVVIGTSERLLTVVYPADYAAGAPYLNLLIVSTGLYSMYMVFANTMLADGKVLLTAGLAGLLVPISMILTWTMTANMGPQGAALAAVGTTAVAVLMAGSYVMSRFAVALDWLSLARIAAAALGVYALTRLPIPGGLWLPPTYVMLGSVYLALLWISGELKAGEFRALLSLGRPTSRRGKMGDLLEPTDPSES